MVHVDKCYGWISEGFPPSNKVVPIINDDDVTRRAKSDSAWAAVEPGCLWLPGSCIAMRAGDITDSAGRVPFQLLGHCPVQVHAVRAWAVVRCSQHVCGCVVHTAVQFGSAVQSSVELSSSCHLY